jgi:hypothetical protein
MNDLTGLPRIWLGVLITAEVATAMAWLSALALIRQSLAAPPTEPR